MARRSKPKPTPPEDLRSPQEIIAEIKKLDAESDQIMDELLELLKPALEKPTNNANLQQLSLFT